MSEDEFNAAIEATRRGVAECMREYTHPGAQSVLRGIQDGLAQELAAEYGVMAPQELADAAQHILGGLGAALDQAPSTTLTGAENGQSINGLGGAGSLSAYGEQGADTDGTAAVVAEWDQPPLEWKPTALRRYLVSDGHEDDQLQARIARKEAANEALVAKLNATMADAQSLQCQNESLQRQNEHWQAECQRLSALLIENERKLAQRMALPSNALRHGGIR